MHQQLVAAFANSFINGERFATIVSAREIAESILHEKIAPGTPAAKLVDESVEQGLVWAARQLVGQMADPIQAWEQCLDLYDRQPALNTRTSTSILQQAYSTPIPIAFLAGKLAGINRETTVYEPTAGNGALLLLAQPNKATVNELNPNRAAALRAQGFKVTQQDASIFLPSIEPVDRIITNPPFGSLRDAQEQARIFHRGLLTTSQLDHAIALLALDLMKPQGTAVLILGGKMGDERSRTQRYNTQLTRGFYRWLYKDAGYKVSDHFSIAGSLYGKQGTSFPIDVIVIEGKGETQLKLPGVQPPRRYESYEALKEVLVYALEQQQSLESNRNPGITLRGVHSRSALDTDISNSERRRTSLSLDNGVSANSADSDNQPTGVFFPLNQASGVADSASNPELAARIRTPGGKRSRGLDSAGDIGVSTNVPEQSVSPAKPSTDGRVPGDELPGATTAMLSSSGAVSSSSTPSPRAESDLFGGHESNRLADVDEHGRESTLLSGLNAMTETRQNPQLNLEILPEETLENQVAYKPRSKAFSLLTLAPAASIKGLENAFNRIEATTRMSVDEYVRTRLNESSQEELFKHYAAEQIDSLALSIFNHEFEDKATLIGHDTGIGKTRIVCGLARYAQQQGMVPVIVTADSVLYADILARDAVDTGNSFNPLITNNGMKVKLTASDEKLIGEINTPKNQAEKIREYTYSGKIGEHDCVFTTYGQLTGPASVERRELLKAIAPHTFLILDESHKAGGAAGERRPKTKAEQARIEREDYVPSCTEFFQQLVTQTQGFVASSATAIKDPIVAARLFYETTDLRLAAPERETFTQHLKAGGVPLQQMVFAMWASSGGCIRCEKSYEGVEFGVEKVPVNLESAENNSKILNLIWRFDRLKEGAVEKISADFAAAGEAAQETNPTLGEAGAASTIFTSVLHNLTAVTSLSLKAEATANAVIADIEQGRKPIIMLFNTMESTIKNFIETHNELADAHDAQFADSPTKRIEVGDTIRINAGELFTRYLEKSRTIKITEPYLDALTGKQKTRSHRLTDEELGEAGLAAYNRAANAIAAADWSKLPISPIDYIKQKVEDAGHSIGEITGRTHVLKYESADDLAAGVVTYRTREHGTAQKKQVMDEFQNGRVDAVITNSTTGYSLHAARTVADQRQRVMYIVQPHLDVNQVEQSIGRSHRSGQVDPAKHNPDRVDEQGQPMWGQYPGTFGLPIFKLVVGQDLPTEERAVAVLMKKMSHLKANTTGNRSSSFGLKEMPDFINDYGNEVAQNLMEQNPQLHADLDYPLGYGEELKDPKAIQKVTGRAVILASEEPPTAQQPYPSLAKQAWLYDTLTSEYKEFLAQKIALGENELEAQKLDLQAQAISRLVLNPGEPEIDSPFTKPAYLVEVQAKTGAKPNTTLQVVNAVRSELGFEAISDLADPGEFERSDVRQRGKDVAQETVDGLRESAEEFLAAHIKVKETEIGVVRGRVGKYQQRLEAQLAISTDLQQRLEGAEKLDNTALIDQLKAQLGQQQPKIDKLRTQLSKAQLDLNGKEFQLHKDQRQAKATLEDVSDLLTRFPVGQGVRLIDCATKNSLYGVVAAVEQKGRSNNPAAPGNWKLKLLVVDGVRSISVRFDSLLKDKKQSLEPVETAPSFIHFKQESSIYELFDQRQTEAKEKRYLVSGQILSAQLTGKFAQITDNEGQVHPVYLLRRGFDPETDLDVKPVKLEEPQVIKQFLFEATGKTGVVQSEDQNLTVIADIRPANGGGIVLKTPKAIAQGGLYFKDEGLIQLTGDFVSKTESVREDNTTKSQSIMTVSVPAEMADEVLSYIAQKWGMGAASHKNAAREMLGQVLPSWEPCNAINPDVGRVPVQSTPKITTSTRNDLQRAFDTDSASRAIPDSHQSIVESSTTGNNATVAQPSSADVHLHPEKQLGRSPSLNQAEPKSPVVNSAPPFSLISAFDNISLASEAKAIEIPVEAAKPAIRNSDYRALNREQLGPLLAEYAKLKDQYPNSLVLKRVGDFYEAFFQDAVILANDLDLVLTSKNSGSPEIGRVPMTGIPHHAIKKYKTSLEELGHTVVVFEEKLALGSAKTTIPSPSIPHSSQPQKAKAVQLSLFDLGLNLASAQLQATPQTSTEVKDVLPKYEVHKTAETTNDVLNSAQQVPASSQSQNITPSTAETRGERSLTPMQIFQQIVERVDKKTGEFLATSQPSSPSLNTLRDWYRAARELGKAQNYLNRISEVASELKQGQPLPDKAFTVMQVDLQAHYKQATTVEQLNQLSDPDFLQLHHSVVDYFKTEPPRPPSDAQIQLTHSQIKQLVNQIDSLWAKQAEQIDTVSKKEKNPFHAWNHKYQEAVAEVQKTMGLISQSINQKEHKEQQLLQWDKLGEAYQAWEKEPHTVEMRNFVEVFKLPQMQARLTNIQQAQQHKQQAALEQQIQQQGRQNQPQR